MEEALAALVAGANGLLDELADGAYSLEVVRRDFRVVDHRNANEARLVKTLSGGETFLVSLALALSLAEQLASMSVHGGSRLESVFLDEGFGTLDTETLDTVAHVIQELGARRTNRRDCHPCPGTGRAGPGSVRGAQRFRHGDGRAGGAVKFTVEPWAPEYGTPTGAELEETTAVPEVDIEVPAREWAPIAPTGEQRIRCCSSTACAGSTPTCGSRSRTERPLLGLCATFAAGAVHCDGNAELVASEVRRGLFTAAAGSCANRHPPRRIRGPGRGRIHAGGIVVGHPAADGRNREGDRSPARRGCSRRRRWPLEWGSC